MNIFARSMDLFVLLSMVKSTSPVLSKEIIRKVRGGCRTAARSKMEHFVIIVNGWKSLTIITKISILHVAAVLDPSLKISSYCPPSTFVWTKVGVNNLAFAAVRSICSFLASRCWVILWSEEKEYKFLFLVKDYLLVFDFDVCLSSKLFGSDF